jgi:flagellar basal body-associated protein FliL
MKKKIIIVVVILVIGVAAYFSFFHEKKKKKHVKIVSAPVPESDDQFDQAQDIAHGSEYLPHE